jgi:hypothetical protein
MTLSTAAGVLFLPGEVSEAALAVAGLSGGGLEAVLLEPRLGGAGVGAQERDELGGQLRRIRVW